MPMQRAPQNEQKADRRLEGEKHRKSNNPVSSPSERARIPKSILIN